MTAPEFLPYGGQVIGEDDIAAVEAVLRSPLLTTGPVVADFEAALARYVGVPHAIACSSGTAGLHLAAMAAGVSKGDLVVVPSITFAATANAALYAGADVVFADVDADTGLMTPDTLLRAVAGAGGPLRAVVPVHLAGQVCAMPEIFEIASANEMTVIEDGCHALGSTHQNEAGLHSVGSCANSDFCVFSFHPVKAIAMGEGGAVTCRDSDRAASLMRLRNHGIVRDAESFTNGRAAGIDSGEANPWYYEVQALGYNYRASDIHCALGLSQLAKLDGFLESRRKLVAHYDEELRNLAPSVAPLTRVPNTSVGWHLYVVLIDFAGLGVSRREVMSALRDRGIGTQVHYIPLHRQPMYVDRYGRPDLPGADRYYERCLSLPLSASMTEDDVWRVVRALTDVLGL